MNESKKFRSIHNLADKSWPFWDSLKNEWIKFYKLGIGNIENDESNYAGYVCPLCKVELFWFNLEKVHFTAEFHLDHFPPETLGGKCTILACKKCNNDFGTNEDELLKEFQWYLFNEGNAEGFVRNVRLSSDNLKGSYKGYFKRQDDGSVFFDFNNGSLQKAPFLKDWVENTMNSSNFKCNLTLTHTDTSKVIKAIAKAAYLTAFSVWGFSFVFSKEGIFFVNNFINHFENSGNEKGEVPLWISDENINSLLNLSPMIVAIIEPKEIRGFGALIPLILGKQVRAVLMPIVSPNSELENYMSYRKSFFSRISNKKKFIVGPIHGRNDVIGSFYESFYETVFLRK